MEEFEQDPIIYTPLVKTKAKFEVLDPTGIVTETHEFEYKAAYWAGRAVLTIGDNLWMVTGNGKRICRIGPEPEEEILLSNPKDPKTVNWDGDEIFVIRYQALTHAQAYMTGDAFDKAERFLKENEDRYIRLTTKNKP